MSNLSKVLAGKKRKTPYENVQSGKRGKKMGTFLFFWKTPGKNRNVPIFFPIIGEV